MGKKHLYCDEMPRKRGDLQLGLRSPARLARRSREAQSNDIVGTKPGRNSRYERLDPAGLLLRD